MDDEDLPGQDRPAQFDLATGLPPTAPGVLAAAPLEAADAPMAVAGQAEDLRQLAETHALFTHGLMFTHGFWRQDPVAAHVAESNGACRPFLVKLPAPVFRWFGDSAQPGGQAVDWNSTICAVEKAQWPSLYRYLLLTEGVNFDARLCIRVIAQKIPLVDVAAMAKLAGLPEQVPTVDCYCFALLTSRRTVYFAPELRRQPWEPVPVMQRNPDPRFVRYAKMLLADRPDRLVE